MTLFTIILSCFCWFAGVHAEEQRVITIDARDPEQNVEVNGKLWYSLHQAIGKGSDVAAPLMDDTVWGRAGQLFGVSSLNLVIGYYSHEGGHWRLEDDKRRALAHVNEIGHQLNLAAGTKPALFPVFRQVRERFRDTQIMSFAAGLNQEEWDAQFLYSRTIDSLRFDEGMAFIFRKFSDVSYLVYTDIRELPKTRNDVGVYRQQLLRKGIDLSEKEYLLHTGITDLLSVRSWESLFAIGGYIADGERGRDTIRWSVGAVDVFPPLLSTYMTPGGFFTQLTTFCRFADGNEAELSIGTDTDFLVDGEVDTLRFGGSYRWIQLGSGAHAPHLRPYAYGSVQRSTFEWKGFSLGVDVNVPLWKETAWLTFQAEYNHKDVMENVINGEGDGERFTIGVEIRF